MSEPRDIYLAACREIAGHLQDDGFRLLKSKPYIVKKESDLIFRIRFQPDFGKVLSTARVFSDINAERPSLFRSLEEDLAESEAFGILSLLVHAEIAAKSMKLWRMRLSHPVRTDDGIAGANVGCLAPENQWLAINLANPHSRPAKVQAVTHLIRAVAFPYFDTFRSPDHVVAALTQAADPGMSATMSLEYAACYGDQSAASRVLNRILDAAPDYIHTEYSDALHEYRNHGLPPPNTVFGKGGENLAFAALALGLEPMP